MDKGEISLTALVRTYLPLPDDDERSTRIQVRHLLGRCLTFEGYVHSRSRFLREHDFYEREVQRRTVEVHQMAHVLSGYETRFHPYGLPGARGVNSPHLKRRHGRWWIQTVMWNVTVDALTAP
jgi:hypothetical protein